MKHIKGLFRRSTELPTALALKGQGWTPVGYAELLEKILAKGAKYNLHADTVTALAGPLASISDPIIRYSCLRTLLRLNPNFKQSSISKSYLRSLNPEQAINYLCVDDFRDFDLCRRLVEMGGGDLVYKSAEDLAPALQLILFQRALTEEDFSSATRLWNQRSKNGLALSEAQQDRFLHLAGSHQNTSVLREIVEAYYDKMTPRLARATLNCALPYGYKAALCALEELSGFLRLADTVHASDLLASNALQVLNSYKYQSFVYEVLLLGVYRRNTSLTVMHLFRYLVSTGRMRLSSDVLQIVANAAYRLGNSKLLSARIWQDACKVGPTRKLCETLLACQFVGSGYRSSFFFLAEMRRRDIYLRRHIQRTMFSKFENLGDTKLVEIFADFKKLDNIKMFDDDLAKKESRPRDVQANANASVYENGKDPEEDPLDVLERMIEFDKTLLA